jgi:molybdopterin converting factor small subunit
MSMLVRAKIMGFIDGQSVQAEGDVELREGSVIETFFRVADSGMGFKNAKHFRRALKQRLAPIVLLNGNRLSLPGDFSRRLKEGDELSVIIPVSGG